LRRWARELRFEVACACACPFGWDVWLGEEDEWPGVSEEVWLRVNGETWAELDGWPAWKGVLKRISATVTAGAAGVDGFAPLPGYEGVGIMCLHLRLRPLTLVEKVQMPFQGEVKV
jgi:hypothetical protein